MFIKPITKTLLLSSIVFVLIVVFGMKYHWVTFFNSPKNKVELTLPQNSIPLTTTEKNNDNKSPFQLEIIQSKKQPITANMSKQQISEGCLQLYNKLGISSEVMIDVIVGDCVVSNYQETIQATATQKRSNLQQKPLVEKRCYQQINQDTRLSALEKQLLWGVCVSNNLNH